MKPPEDYIQNSITNLHVTREEAELVWALSEEAAIEAINAIATIANRAPNSELHDFVMIKTVADLSSSFTKENLIKIVQAKAENKAFKLHAVKGL